MENKRLLPVKLDSYKPLREIVFETLREAILDQVLKPGERLMEVQLAEELGVSRTPVREAIRKLELEGLVVMVPRKGAYVAGISLRDVREVFEIRIALETLAAKLAAERITKDELEVMEVQLAREFEETEASNVPSIVAIDTDFHDLLYKASRNQKLMDMISNLRDQLHRFRSASLASPGRGKIALEEHRMIFDALRTREVEKVGNLAKLHIERAEEAFMKSIDKNDFTD